MRKIIYLLAFTFITGTVLYFIKNRSATINNQKLSVQESIETKKVDKIVLGESNDLFKAADIKFGKELSVGCTACHSIEKNGPSKIGPNLFGIVGSRIGKDKSYNYTPAFKNKFKDESYWTIDNLYEWLRDPSEVAPGTGMAFGGMLDPQDRMDLIAYLNTLR